VSGLKTKEITNMLQAPQIAIITDYFKNKPVLKAYIFGSHASNQAGIDSDIDILVELDYSQPIGLKYIKMQNELQEKLKCKVDLLSTNSISKYLQSTIDHQKQLIYEK